MKLLSYEYQFISYDRSPIQNGDSVKLKRKFKLYALEFNFSCKSLCEIMNASMQFHNFTIIPTDRYIQKHMKCLFNYKKHRNTGRLSSYIIWLCSPAFFSYSPLDLPSTPIGLQFIQRSLASSASNQLLQSRTNSIYRKLQLYVERRLTI